MSEYNMVHIARQRLVNETNDLCIEMQKLQAKIALHKRILDLPISSLCIRIPITMPTDSGGAQAKWIQTLTAFEADSWTIHQISKNKAELGIPIVDTVLSVKRKSLLF